MAKVEPIGTPQNEGERRVIARLRDELPDGYTIFHNLEIDGSEIDILVIAPHAVYLVDVKGTRGIVHVHAGKWHPEGREPFFSPVLKARQHARVCKGLLVDKSHDLKKVFVAGVVVLCEDNTVVNDPEGKEGGGFSNVVNAPQFFQNTSIIPDNCTKDIRNLFKPVRNALVGKAKPRHEPKQFGNWKVVERLGETDQSIEYLSRNAYGSTSSACVSLKVYSIDPYQDEDARNHARERIRNSYDALTALPPHPAIPRALDFGASEDESQFYLVQELATGKALRLCIDQPASKLTFDQRKAVVTELLSALGHAHANGVIHRNVTPSTVMVGADGQTRLIAFDYSRPAEGRSFTIAEEAVSAVDDAYIAPEVYLDATKTSERSDVFSAGVVFYEMFTDERPFEDQTQVFEAKGEFPMKPSEHDGSLPEGFDDWLQLLCYEEPEKRPTAAEALEGFLRLLSPETKSGENVGESTTKPMTTKGVGGVSLFDLRNLPAGYQLTQKYKIEKMLGKPGGFGVVYKAIDVLGDIAQAVKIIDRDKISKIERLKQEYQPLLKLPEHQNVVKVVTADFLPEGDPYIAFSFVEGLDVFEMMQKQPFSLPEAKRLALDTLSGLAHIHKHEVYHCDIKPSNLLWSEDGVVIIDFNVAISPGEGWSGGATERYLPPDFQIENLASPEELIDRDLYALGLTLYEAVTNNYPWKDASKPIPGRDGIDPRQWDGCDDLSDALVAVMMRSIAPKRENRFDSAEAFMAALQEIKDLRKPIQPREETLTWETAPTDPNYFLHYLLTLYSQSKHSNAGTRGLSEIGAKVYVPTALDSELTPAVFRGDFKLVIISGNAGDGKTAFLQKVEKAAKDGGANVSPAERGNGAQFEYNGRKFLSNYDGSQDEGDKVNDEVLLDFFAPYEGKDTSSWPDGETRLIAINEGRLIDFLETQGNRFQKLQTIVEDGLLTSAPDDEVAVVNLNLRSVVADSKDGGASLMEQLVNRLTDPKLWAGCEFCELKEKCYVHHNVRTFQDASGAQVLDRLKALYTLTALRGKLHITLRDLGSAIAYMIVGERNCDEIHSLYDSGDREAILQGFYFNSWMGGDQEQRDRLLKLLQQLDVGKADDSRLDRALDFRTPDNVTGLRDFEGRGDYPIQLLAKLHEDLPWDYESSVQRRRIERHRDYVTQMRRLFFFERRDDGWQSMLPYRHGKKMLDLVRKKVDPAEALSKILDAINRGEGLFRPKRLDNNLALQVRHVEKGTIRSYRLFPGNGFRLEVQDDASQSPFLEHMPSGMLLQYWEEGEKRAEMTIDLDVFEMLCRLNEGFRPTVEEIQGYYLSLTVFKNILASTPYQEILLTMTGHDFYKIERKENAVLTFQTLDATTD